MSLLLTIAMPCFNEEACVEQVVREALSVIDELEHRGAVGEVLVVDDASTDGTPEILAALAAADPRVRVITHERNAGIGGFNRRMMEEARGDWVLFTSSDGEFDPHEGIRFIDIAERDGADAVLGYRTEKRYDTWRHAVSYSFNGLTLLCFGTRFRDIGSTRLLRRALFQPIELHSRSAFLNAERLLAGRRRGARIVQVPTVHRPRLAGRGGGAKPRRVAEAIRDLLATRLRWFRFDHYYG
ncbi:MAG TPA: glycosyltransferase family 2 protein [Kofleriaceae bacterium]|nr:glycosyltransferase family 2 protein [Kofleriaceae bacterium]